MNVFDSLPTVQISQLRVTQAADGVVFIQTLLCLGGGFDVPLQQWHFERTGDFLGQHGFASARLAFDQEWPLKGDGRVDGQHQILGRDIVGRTLEFHGGGLTGAGRR